MDEKQFEDLRARLDRLESIEEIRSLKYRYGKACDAPYDAELIASFFVEDGVWDGGIFGRYEGPDAIRDHFKTSPERMYWQNTYVMCPDIQMEPGAATASATWYLWEPCVLPAPEQPGGKVAAWLMGKYQDEYRRVGDRWYFSSVTYRTDFLSSFDKGWVEEPMRGRKES